MFTPAPFRIDDTSVLHQMMDEIRLAHFITATPEGPQVSLLPLYLMADEGPHGTLYGHFARANPHWQSTPQGPALAIFTGVHGYVSPNWYPSKQRHGRAVPTWNYASIEVRGEIEIFHEPAELHAVVEKLTDLHEGLSERPWKMNDAPEEYLNSQLSRIVGLKIHIQDIEGKLKMSQNKSPEDREGVAQALAQSPRESDQAMAGWIRDAKT